MLKSYVRLVIALICLCLVLTSCTVPAPTTPALTSSTTTFIESKYKVNLPPPIAGGKYNIVDYVRTGEKAVAVIGRKLLLLMLSMPMSRLFVGIQEILKPAGNNNATGIPEDFIACVRF